MSYEIENAYQNIQLFIHSCVFILASDSPTKLDSEVLLALNDVEIDPLSHYNVTRWKNKIVSYSSSQRQR